MNTARRLVFLLLSVIVTAAVACQPAPSRVLNQDEKRADMFWLFSIFDENYAPRELKEETLEFDYAELKARYLEEALATTDNDSFYLVMHRFVSEFADPHTSSSLLASSIPGRTKTAYLGFSGVRVGDGLVVTSLLPTTQIFSSFPIQVGDEITALDGVPLRDVVLNEMVKYRNLGHDEANLTVHMNAIFNRTPLAHPLPTERDAVLTVNRFGEVKQITLPWIVKDLTQFLDEQAAAAAGTEFKVAEIDGERFFKVAKDLLENGDLSLLDVPFAMFRGPKFWNYFGFVDTNPTYTSPSVIRKVREQIRLLDNATASVADLRERVAAVRPIPPDAIFLAEAQTYPTYFAPYPSTDPEAPVRFYGYILFDHFTPADEILALGELQTVYSRLAGLGIKDLIIDTLDNGGGSLIFGLHAAKQLSGDPLLLPKIQFKVSETWIDEFETQSLFGPSDAEKELARRVLEDLLAARDAGAVVADPMSVDVMMPFQFLDGNDAWPQLNVVVSINELCVSMCDIFAATLQDNGLATIMGSRSMGGGGNVVQHAQAPNSHLSVAQTESLILRHDGTPIENLGVTPDVPVNTNAAVQSNYADVITQAVTFLQTGACTENCDSADDLGRRRETSDGGCAVGNGSTSSGLAMLLALCLGLAVRRRRH